MGTWLLALLEMHMTALLASALDECEVRNGVSGSLYIYLYAFWFAWCVYIYVSLFSMKEGRWRVTPE